MMRLERVGAVSPPSRRRWQPRDCALYAARARRRVGASSRSCPTAWAIDEQLVYPTFVLTICAAESQSWPDAGFATGDYEPHQLVLGSQSLELARPLPPRGDVTVRTRVVGIDDKGSGALVRLEIAAADTATGALAFVAGISLFVIGGGGFGGERGPREPDRTPPASSARPRASRTRRPRTRRCSIATRATTRTRSTSTRPWPSRPGSRARSSRARTRSGSRRAP